MAFDSFRDFVNALDQAGELTLAAQRRRDYLNRKTRR